MLRRNLVIAAFAVGILTATQSVLVFAARNGSAKKPALAAEPNEGLTTFSAVTGDGLTSADLSALLSSTTPTLGLETITTSSEELAAMAPADLDTTIPASEVIQLPDSPLPKEELDDLTTKSRNAKRITLMSAVCRALECNQALRVEKLRPEISNTGIESAESEFDTQLNAGLFRSTQHSSTLGPLSRNAGTSSTRAPERDRVSRNTDASVGISGRLPTGTNYGADFSINRNTTNQTQPFYNSALNMNITQNLLRGAGCEVNLIRVWTAQNDFVSSLYQLQQTLIDLISDVQLSYWDLYLAMETLRIRITGYEVAKEQRQRTEEFVRVGKSPPLELMAAQAEESARISDVINAAADLKARQLDMLRQVNPEGLKRCWRTSLFADESPVLPDERLVAEERVRLARYYRPDLRQAQIDLANGELEVVRTENGLLPALDLVAETGVTGVGDHLRHALDEVGDREFPNWRVGLQFSYSLQNRAARADYRRANFQKRLAEEAIANFCQIIEFDVRTAINDIERTKRLISSTQITQRLRVEELAAEIEKFRVGRSTQLLVAQAQRDLTSAQLAEVTAEVANIRAYIQLYRAEGTSLQRLGITPVCITPESGADKH